MIESFLITSRETLEASLVIGIVLSYLHRTHNHSYKKNVYYGIIFGILASIATAFLFSFFSAEFEGQTESLFEGITMLVGSVLLTTMILWMMKQRHMTAEIEGKVQKHLEHQSMFSSFGIFLLVFVAIFREGVETVIFLNAAQYASGVNFIAGTIGVLAAILVGYLFFVSVRTVNMKKLFTVSSVLLILFAAGLVAHGVDELVDAQVIPAIVDPLYNLNPVMNSDGSYPLLHEQGAIGSFLRGLFGYNGDPSLIEVSSYFFYLGIIAILFYRVQKSKIPSSA